MSPQMLNVDDEYSTLDHDLNQDSQSWRFESYYDPQFHSTLNDELDRISALEQNWDGYNAPPLTQELIDAARILVDVLDGIACRPNVVPLSGGGVQFEWHNGPQSLELGIEGFDHVNYLKYDPRYGMEEDGFISLPEDTCIEIQRILGG